MNAVIVDIASLQALSIQCQTLEAALGELHECWQWLPYSSGGISPAHMNIQTMQHNGPPQQRSLIEQTNGRKMPYPRPGDLIKHSETICSNIIKGEVEAKTNSKHDIFAECAQATLRVSPLRFTR